jgi:hypothetical protein
MYRMQAVTLTLVLAFEFVLLPVLFPDGGNKLRQQWEAAAVVDPHSAMGRRTSRLLLLLLLLFWHGSRQTGHRLW